MLEEKKISKALSEEIIMLVNTDNFPRYPDSMFKKAQELIQPANSTDLNIGVSATPTTTAMQRMFNTRATQNQDSSSEKRGCCVS